MTLQLTPKEKIAIDWLARIPEALAEKIPSPFRHLARKPSRHIARELSGPQIRKLADLHANLNPKTEAPPS